MTQQPFVQNAAGAANERRAADGTREYRLHSASHKGRIDIHAPGALNAKVYRGLKEKAFYPGLALSGEVARAGEDGRPRIEDEVVHDEVEMRREFPYG